MKRAAGPTRPRRSRRSCLPSLGDRKLWFVGIGGAGLSGYAVLAKAWGAEVAGWDRHETPYLCVQPASRSRSPSDRACAGRLRSNRVHCVRVRGPVPGHGWRSRAEFLAELVSLQDSIVVARAHGKTTTAG